MSGDLTRKKRSIGNPAGPPHPGEDIRAYTERLNAAGVESMRPVQEHFGASQLASKALWLASEEFNARFSFDGWRDRRDRSLDEYGPRKWLQRTYKLDDNKADRIAAAFDAGNERALVEECGFETLAIRRLTLRAVEELHALGVVSDATLAAKRDVDASVERRTDIEEVDQMP